MDPVIILPARGGSKRIPRKNIRPFHGTPMIARAIATARAAVPDARIVVSTDDAEIAEIARTAGAEIPFQRPASLSDDHANTTQVITHAVETLELAGDTCVCCLYPTVPLLTPERIAEGHAMLEQGVDFVFAGIEFPAPPQRALLLDDRGFSRPVMPDQIGARSQDLEPWFHDAGQFYWGHADSWRTVQVFFEARNRCVVLPRGEVCDIDTPEDWDEAERLFRLSKGQA